MFAQTKRYPNWVAVVKLWRDSVDEKKPTSLVGHWYEDTVHPPRPTCSISDQGIGWFSSKKI